MGVEPYLLTATVTGLVAQRLVRRLCPACRRSKPVAPEVAARYGLADSPVLWYPGGCPQCGGSGWAGRVGVLEVLTLDDSVRRLILRRADISEIQDAARANGMRTMLEDGIAKALAGETALEEVLRVTREE